MWRRVLDLLTRTRRPLVFMDFETAGLSGAPPVEFAALVWAPWCEPEMDALSVRARGAAPPGLWMASSGRLNPGRAIEHGAMRVHGISDADVAKAPRFDDLEQRSFWRALAEGSGDELPAIFAHARRRRLSEVELLRFKPSGRGARAYADQRCTDLQHRRFLPHVLRAARRQRVRVKVDCSYTPMVAWHDPGPEVLGALAVYGCTGGDFLVGAKATGALTACSFAPPPPLTDGAGARPRVSDLGAYWSSPGAFGSFREWRSGAEPCRSCAYHALCRGGCRVVSGHAGDDAAPDPECPRVVEHRRSGAGAAPLRRHLPVV